MTRDARKRWLTRIALVALAGLIGLGMWLRWGARSPSADAPSPDDPIGQADLQAADETDPPVMRETGPLGPLGPDASLVVAELEALPGHHAHRTRVIRYDFKNGQVQPPETVWDGCFDYFNFPAYWWPIVGNRYLFAENGSVIDLQEKTLIHEGAGRLEEVSGDRVISGSYSSSGELQRVVAFNLRTREIEKLPDNELETITQRYKLAPQRSPDGTKSIVVWDNTLLLQRVGHPSKDWGHFNVGGQSNCYPGLWLDNERFLTQDGTGNLLTVGLDGVRVPVVQIPVKEKVIPWFKFRRDADGRIIYDCSGREHFFINTEAKTWERCVWESRGHGFEERSLGDNRCRRVYRYKGTEIARSPYSPFPDSERTTTEGYIAVFVEGGLCVWSVGTGKWTKLDERHNHIGGWIK